MSESLERRSGGEISKYDPEVGLKTVAVAEAAEKYFRRAKDAEKLIEAVTLKLTEQRNFVLWWEANKPLGGRGKTHDRSVTGLPDNKTLSRWRRKLATEAAFKDSLNAATQRCLEVCEMEKAAHVAEATGYYEWYTPPEIIEAARRTMGGIDLDPASSTEAQVVVRAAEYFTVKDNGLTKAWAGRVWMNPPYSQPLIEEFCIKLIKEVMSSSVCEAVTLTNNATETAWGQALINASAAICFPRGRVEFWGHEKGSVPLQGQMICYMGLTHGDIFRQEFASLGPVVMVPHV